MASTAVDPESVRASIERQLEGFALGNADLLAQRELLKRVDTKFVVPAHSLGALLESLRGGFALLTAEGAPLDDYVSVYFDTPEHALYHAHRVGRRPRSKVRIRHYSRRDVCFLEVKTKDKYNVTSKFRKKRKSRDFELSEADRSVLEPILGQLAFGLEPVMRIEFPRVTLLSLHDEERLTLDLGVTFRGPLGAREHSNAVIAEIKQSHFGPRTPGMRAFREIGVRPFSISKFCVAVAELGGVEQISPFKPALRTLSRLDHA